MAGKRARFLPSHRKVSVFAIVTGIAEEGAMCARTVDRRINTLGIISQRSRNGRHGPTAPRVRGELAIPWRDLVVTERLLPRPLARQDRRRGRRAVANPGRGPISLTRLWRESMGSDRPRHDTARVQK